MLLGETKEAVTESKGATMATPNAVGALLGRLREWWRKQEELNALDEKEVRLVAADLGIGTNTLKDLIVRGPEAAHLLYERMRTLGISKADVDDAAQEVMRDLQRTCACCNEKGLCEWDLVLHPDDPVWKGYCPNAVTLDSLRKLKAHTPVKAQIGTDLLEAARLLELATKVLAPGSSNPGVQKLFTELKRMVERLREIHREPL
jgi:hypothetical protein